MIINKKQVQDHYAAMGVAAGPGFLIDPRRACSPEKSVDPEWWFPETLQVRRHAISICRGCTFRWECDAYATKNDEQYGVWGGYLRTGRRSTARTNQRAANV